MTLVEFIKQYYDVPNTGDTPQNQGQCVGLVEQWIDSLSLPHVWGNAADLLTNADPNSYDIIQNTPDNVPSFGDIFVFGSSYGGGVGHTGIVVAADANIVSLFEQNDGINGGTPQFKTYTYDGALGWLHPKGVVVDDESLIDALRNERDNNWNLYQSQIQKTTALQQQLSDTQSQLTECQNKPSQVVIPTTEIPVTATTSNGDTIVKVAVTTPEVPKDQTVTITPPVEANQPTQTVPTQAPWRLPDLIVWIITNIKSILLKGGK